MENIISRDGRRVAEVTGEVGQKVLGSGRLGSPSS
jgi:hypothetical protein